MGRGTIRSAVSGKGSRMATAYRPETHVHPGVNVREQIYRCTFCSREQNVTGRLIAGPACTGCRSVVYICRECVQACTEIFKETGQAT